MKINNTLKLIIAIIVSELAGIIGALFTTPSIPTWYASLTKPALNPPSWLFGPVWTMLFALMGISAFLIWKQGIDKKDIKTSLGIFIGQLILNLFWSIIFFGMHMPGAAFAEIILLWLAILATIMAFARISRLAAWLLFPYILWVTFAGYLNYSIWRLNPVANQDQSNNTSSTTTEIKPNDQGTSTNQDIGEENKGDYTGWKTATDKATGVIFKYPESIGTKYIDAYDWPPKVQVLNKAFTCDEAGKETQRAGQTKKVTINGNTYCVTKVVEGAAGSTYTQYAYAFAEDNKTVILTFTVREPQCANYDEPKQSECKKEQSSFDLNSIIDKVAKSIDL